MLRPFVNLKIILYAKLLRPLHWPKNLVVTLGSLFVLTKTHGSFNFHNVILIIAGTLLACGISSANYILNQVVDTNTDNHHPIKKNRPLPSGIISKKNAIVFMFFILLVTISLSFKLLTLYSSLWLIVLFLAGIIYNVPPLRLKDIAYLDVISESINNPIRFLVGWSIFSSAVNLPILFLFFLWTSGASLMSIKRYIELNSISKKEAIQYRKSFVTMTSQKLVYMTLFWFGLSLIFLRYSFFK